MTTRNLAPKADADSFYEVAVKALARRARSTAEIRLLLERKNASERKIEEVLHRLRENGYLDDARFGRYFASSRLENDLHGKARVRRDLKSRGVKENIAEKAIGKAYEGIDENEVLRQYIKRKVNVALAFAKPSSVASLHRRLLRAGFASDTIVRELKRMLQSSPRAGKIAAGRAGSSSAVEPVAWDELLDSLSEIPETEECD